MKPATTTLNSVLAESGLVERLQELDAQSQIHYSFVSNFYELDIFVGINTLES